MAPVPADSWQQHNQRYLIASLNAVRVALQQHIARIGGATPEVAPTLSSPTPEAGIAPSALETLCTTFGLSAFERDLLLLCAGVELDAGFAASCAEAQGDPQRTSPTFSLALAALPHAHWNAITPDAPLRRWRLLSVGAGGTLTQSPLRIDERILHYLTGITQIDERLHGLLEPISVSSALVPSHQRLADQVTMVWQRTDRRAPLPVVQLCGEDRTMKRGIAQTVCTALGLRLHRLPADVLPTQPSEVETLSRLLEREIVLSGSALLLDCDDLDNADARAHAATRLVERISSPLFVVARERRPPLQRATLTLDVRTPPANEQRDIWQVALGQAAQHLNGHVDLLVGQFNLSAQAIREASNEAMGMVVADQEGTNNRLPELLWDACRNRARPRLDDLAQRIDGGATWDDLVLPAAQQQVLREIAAHVRQRARVYEQWGFAGKGGRGLGISALFAGVSGTGKTMSAEVIASTLRLDLYRIDLSSVVSKYIGETEKNLRRIFDAAEAGGAILLFDEADALFGKRSEVKDSHDRYANIEVSYLLQRMEAYRGLAILTTNLKSAIDTAFMRRIRFVVQYPFPDAVQRAEIWRRIFPRATPVDNLQYDKLARLNVAGGNIRNIALNAAFFAADENTPVRMPHILRAARGEYAKLEKPLTESEIGGWV